ncbi:hypothetical protein [Kribbella sp. DT2]|uniref:hypothetical protein n=1 Tax=Kribbella sp. DT2 TaxID=3393427 RepID=UPI003CF7D1F0
MSDSQADRTGEGARLLKLRLPAQLVRDMDEAILASRGAYFDRNEFVTEAVWDRLAEEGLSIQARVRMATEPDGSEWQVEAALEATPPTAPRLVQEGHNFGLHNRDLPTLWVLADLMVNAADGLEWTKYFEQLRERAQKAGRWLRKQDADSHAAVKAAVGFPRDGAKAKASEDRFLSTAVGAPRSGQGPAFLMGLIGVAGEPAEVRPTPEAVELLRELAATGLTHQVPQSAEAARRWLRHLQAVASQEHATWLQVLRALEGRPTRADLTDLFPQWPGTQADTNCMGYISRGREWGLVRPELVDGRYELTDLGHQVVMEGVKTDG